MFTLGKTLAHQNPDPGTGHRVRVIMPAPTNRLTQQILAVRFGGGKTNPTLPRAK